MAEAPDLSVVIVNWNAGDALLRCLASLYEHPPAGAWEAIVVDNASTDGSIERVERDFPGVRVARNPTNIGLAAANNQGIRQTTGELIVISNPDVLYCHNTFVGLTAAFRRHPRAAFVFAKLLHEDGAIQTSAGDLPSLGEALRGYGAAGGNGATGFWWHGWAHDVERRIAHGGEACYGVRRAALADIGLQDEKYVLDWEGIDWCARAQASGWECWFVPDAEAVHLGGQSIKQATGRWVVSSHRGMYRYFSRRRPWMAPVLAVVIGLRMLLKLAAALAGRRLYDRAVRRQRR